MSRWSRVTTLPAAVMVFAMGSITVPLTSGPAALAADMSAPVVTIDSGDDAVPVVVHFEDEDARDEALGIISAAGVEVDAVWSDALLGFAADLPPDLIEELASVEGLIDLEPDDLVTLAVDQTNPPWGIDRVDQRRLPLDGRFRSGRTGAGVRVYIVDTGVRTTHADLAGRVLPGVTTVADLAPDAGDCNGHGTHVAGTVAGTIHGVAKSALIVPVRTLGCRRSGPVSDTLSGLDWIAQNHRSLPPGTPGVVSMSITTAANSTFDAAVSRLVDLGLTVVAASGNDGSSGDSCQRSPARMSSVITVGASDESDRVASFSSAGSCTDIFAPGVGIVSASHRSDTGTTTLDGTSMATPFVAGRAAILLEASPTSSPATIAGTILMSATTGALTGRSAGMPDRLVFSDPASPAAGPPPPPPPPPVDPVLPGGPGFSGIGQPVRVLDTRPTGMRIGAADGSGAPRSIRVTGIAGVPSTGVSAVSLNITVTDTEAPTLGAGYVTVYPCGPRPNTSSVNFVAGQVVANSVIAPVSSTGEVCLYVYGRAHVLVDLFGYSTTGFRSIEPTRLTDTRTAGRIGSSDGSGGPLVVDVLGRAGIPTTGVAAVALNVTVVDTSSPAVGVGYVTVYPCGTRPDASTLNFGTGGLVANSVVTPVGADGRVCVYVYGTAHVLVDVSGYFVAGFSGRSPLRVVDTRRTTRIGSADGSAGPLVVELAGSVPTGSVAAALNVTVTNTSSPTVGIGYLTVSPCGAPPTVSTLNFRAGQTVANSVIVPLGSTARFCIYAYGVTDVLVDVLGAFSA